MSDKHARSREQPQQTSDVPSSMRGRPGPIHQELWNSIMAAVDEKVKEYAPTFGTVTGKDGGKVTVHVDDEDDPRNVGFSRKKGQRYENGDRVKVQKTRAGEYIADGTFSGKAGRDPAVDNDDLYSDAIDTHNMRRNSVNNDALAGDSVKRQNLHGEVQKYIDDQGDIGRAAQQTANQAQNDAGKAQNRAENAWDRAGEAKNDASSAQNKADNAFNKAGDAQSTANDAKSTANSVKSDVSDLQRQINELKEDIKKLKK